MHESIQFWLDEGQESMDKAIQHLQFELSKLRAGKASPSMLEDVRVDYYGTPTPLHQLANVNTPDARTLSVQPWEKSSITPIEKAIMAANLGFNPQNDGRQGSTLGGLFFMLRECFYVLLITRIVLNRCYD